jgi:hypothetical protein
MKNAARDRRALLLKIAALLAAVKALEFAADSTAAFTSDSGAYMLNAMGRLFWPQRSFMYGLLIRAFALPLHSLTAIVVMQMAMGAMSALLLAFVLLRYFRVRPWVAIAAALVFACDPAQVLDEHMVMTECAAMLAMAVFLTAACGYVESPRAWRLIAISFAGAVLGSIRLVFLPPVLVFAAILPLAALWYAPHAFTRTRLAGAVAISCGAALFFQWGSQRVADVVATRVPEHLETSGFFLAAAVAPLIEPRFADDPRVAAAIVEQNRSAVPLGAMDFRARQLWTADGFRARLTQTFQGDDFAADRAAGKLAKGAILHRPAGFLRLGGETYLEYWRNPPRSASPLWWEIGMTDDVKLLPRDAAAIESVFGTDVSRNHQMRTRSRAFYLDTRWWLMILLLAPFVMAAAVWVGWAQNRPAAIFAILMAVWVWLLLASTCLGATEHVYRYLHPFSFTTLAAVGFLANAMRGESA